MAVETSAVSIKINVVDPSSGQVIQNVTGNLDKLGAAGMRAGQSVRRGMDEAGVGSLSAVERMRLVTEEAGVRLPRAFLRLAAQSKLASEAISAIGPAMMGIAAIQIGGMLFTQLYEGAKKFYEKWLDADGAIEKFNREADEAASKRFYENAGISELTSDLQKASQQLDQLNQKQANSPKWWGLLGAGGSSLVPGAGATPALVQSYFSPTDAASLNASQQQSDSDRQKLIEETHKHNLQLVEDEGLKARAKLTGIAQERQARKTADREADEETRYKIAQQELLHEITSRPQDKKPGEKGYVTPVPEPGADAYGAENRDAKAHAQAQYEARADEIKRQNARELSRIHEEALESSLRGSALYEQQEAHAIDELGKQGIATAGAVNDLKAKFHNEEMRRLEDERRETERMEREAGAAGLTGIAKLQAEGLNRVADIEADPNLDPADRARRTAAARVGTQQQILEAEQQLTQRVNQLADEAAEHQIGGFRRIDAEGKKRLDDLRAEIERTFGKAPTIGPPSVAQATGQRLLAQGSDSIGQMTADQKEALARRNAEETEQIEAQARIKLLSAEKQQTAAIDNEYQERLRKYKEELGQQEISDDDYNRRVVAAAQEREAQLVDAARQAREKMAGEFDSFFKGMNHPLQYLQQVGDKIVGEAAAALVQRMQAHLGGQGAAATNPGGMLGSIFDKIAGVPKGTREPGAAEGPGAGIKAIALSTAEILIQNASIGFGGTNFGGGMPGRGALGATGSAGSYSIGSGGAFALPTFGPGGTSGFAGPYSIGGAGSAGYSGTASSPGVGGAGIANPARITGAGVVNDVGQGITLAQSMGRIFSGGRTSGTGSSSEAGAAQPQSVSSDADQIAPQPMQNMPLGARSPSNGGMLGGGGFGANLGGAASGALGVYSAYEGTGGVGGALSGAMSGMQLGMALGGPLGAAIGAAGGAVLGAIGMGGREKARVYDLKQVRPHMAEDEQGFETGSMDYLTAYADMQTLDTTAERTTKQWGPAAHSYYNDIIRTEIAQTKAKFTSMERSGRSNYTASAAQYDVGTDAVPRTGMAVIHQGERIVPSDQNERITRAVESGAESTHMATAGAWGGDVHFHVHALDTKNARQAFMDHKHLLRAAINESYAENSGGADAGY